MGAMKVWDGTTWQTVAPFSERASVYVGPDQPAGATYAGDLWWDTDDPSPTMPRQELHYSQITAAVTASATTAATATVVLPGAAVNYDGSPIYVEFFSPQVQTPATGQYNSVLVHLWDGTTDLGYGAQYITPTVGTLCVPGYLRRRIVPTAGSHTYSIRAWTSNGTNGSIGAGAGGAGALAPAFLRITRV